VVLPVGLLEEIHLGQVFGHCVDGVYTSVKSGDFGDLIKLWRWWLFFEGSLEIGLNLTEVILVVKFGFDEGSSLPKDAGWDVGHYYVVGLLLLNVFV